MSILTSFEIKEMLFDKLTDEGTGFTMKDISIRKINNKNLPSFLVTIKDYEHCPFEITLEEDDYFGYCIEIYERWDNRSVSFTCSKRDYQWYEAIYRLGYWIASRF